MRFHRLLLLTTVSNSICHRYSGLLCGLLVGLAEFFHFFASLRRRLNSAGAQLASASMHHSIYDQLADVPGAPHRRCRQRMMMAVLDAFQLRM